MTESQSHEEILENGNNIQLPVRVHMTILENRDTLIIVEDTQRHERFQLRFEGGYSSDEASILNQYMPIPAGKPWNTVDRQQPKSPTPEGFALDDWNNYGDPYMDYRFDIEGETTLTLPEGKLPVMFVEHLLAKASEVQFDVTKERALFQNILTYDDE